MENGTDMAVPAEYAAEIRKLFPKTPTDGLLAVLKRGLSRVRAERNWAKKHGGAKAKKS